VEQTSERARQVIEAARSELVELSEDLHAHPELSFEERRSAGLVADLLAQHGFEVAHGIAGMPTAFDARYGSGRLHLSFMAEYDALPEVGHACGHNLIAAIAVGAGLGLKAVADELDVTVSVLGTPAEEAGGGKVVMIDHGVFDDVHAAMMVHPWSFDRLESACLAVDQFEVTYTGKTAHASAAPEQGRNAADAMVIAQVAIGQLRQQLAPGDQVHGIVVQGGAAANIIPDHVVGRFMCRSRTIEGLGLLRPRIDRCFEAGALAAECDLAMTEMGPSYSHLSQDRELLALFRRHAEERGRTFDADDDGVAQPTYSTDMANVSLVVPSIHPLLGLETHGAVNHQPEFTAACVGASAESVLLDGAVALCLTAIDAAADASLRERLLAR